MIKPVNAKQLIPHYPPMCMIDRIVDYDDKSNRSIIELTIDKNSPFTAHNKVLDTECFLEIIAQASAAQHGLDLQRRGAKKEKCFLVGATNFNIYSQAYVGDKLTVIIKCDTEIASVSSLFGKIFKGKEEIASATITVWHKK